MAEIANVSALLEESESLSKEYQDAINLQNNSRSKALTREVIIKQQARSQIASSRGESWPEYASKRILNTSFMKDPIYKDSTAKQQVAERLAATIENNMVRTNSLIRSASYWENNREVDSNRMRSEARRNQNVLGTEVVNVLNSSKLVSNSRGNALPGTGETFHTYKTTYHEHESIGKASTLAHEPEDLEQVLDYIEGYQQHASMKQVIDHHADAGERLPAAVLTYLASKSHDTDAVMTVMSVDDVERNVLADAAEAGLDIKVVNHRQEKPDKVNVRKIAEQKDYQRALVLASVEIATTDDKLDLHKIPSVSNSFSKIRSQMVANEVPGNDVGSFRKYIHSEAKKQGVLPAVEHAEKYTKNVVAKTKSQLKPKDREAVSKNAIDGGRKLNESRPGANSRF